MNDLEKKSIECIKNMPIEETTYQVARNVVLDYITNLQQENERLKEKSINEVLKNDFDMCVKDLKKANKKIEKLEDYKSRIEKAVEYLKDNAKYQKVSINNNKYYSEYIINQVLDILDGSDE